MDELSEQEPTGRPRIIDRIRFEFERLLVRGVYSRLLLAAAIVILVSLVAGGLVALLVPDFESMGDAVWWAFLRLTDPGYLGDDEGLARRFVSTLVTVLGYVLFLGVLIAILTQWLNDTIEKLEAGTAPVVLSNHVVLLGWTHRTPTIVSELLCTKGRAKRFLERKEANKLRIVILAEHVDAAMVRTLRERLGNLWNDRQVLLRAGTPLQIDHLERVAFRRAAIVLVLGPDFVESNLEAVDAQTVKTLMAVSRNLTKSGYGAPLAVVELFDQSREDVARRAYAGESAILPADLMISRMILQSVRQRGLCGVFSELLTLNYGNALFIRKIEGLVGSRFSDLRGRFSRAIPLGTVRRGGMRPDLNPDPETVIEDENLLVFVARSYEDCVVDGTQGAAEPVSALPSMPPAEEPTRRLLILGWSRKVPALLQEFERYGETAFEIDVVSSTPLAEREKLLTRRGGVVSGGRVRQIEAGYTVPEVLERLEPQGYDNIILLASERLTSVQSADATTVLAYLMLQRILPEKSPRPEMFVEILDEENLSLFQDHSEDVIVSPTLVCYLLSQVSLRWELADVFTELFQTWGTKIILQPALHYVRKDDPVRFGDLECAAAARDDIALGLLCPEGPGANLALNPDRDAQWTLAPGDQVVLLTADRSAKGQTSFHQGGHALFANANL
jgi:hypothetical protein